MCTERAHRGTRREEKNSSHSDLAETHVMLKLQHGRKFSHQNSFHPCLTKATPWAYLSHIDPNHGEEFSHTNTPLLNANKHRAWHLLPALLHFQLHPATKFLKPRYSGKQHPRAICIAEKHWKLNTEIWQLAHNKTGRSIVYNQILSHGTEEVLLQHVEGAKLLLLKSRYSYMSTQPMCLCHQMC